MINFHSYNIGTCLKELKSSLLGLTWEEADRRLKKDGPNMLPKKKRAGKILLFVSQFKSPLIYILIIGGVFSLALKENIEAGVIFLSIFINVLIGFFEENKANNALEKLRNIVEHKSLVLRDGSETEIDSKNLVVGDVIIIENGNRISADARLISANDLKIDEANLTGESFPASKSIDRVEVGSSLADRTNMIYSSTVVVDGRGSAIITATGKDTEIGKIAQMVGETKEEKTPLQERLASFSNFLGIAFVVICFFVVFIGVYQQRDFLEMFLISIALAVSAIPEGLAVSVTFILVIGMQEILRKKALVRKLISTETLGSTTVICTDKTGTLTEGKMTVSNIVIGEKEFEIDNLGSRQSGEEAKVTSLALQIAMMCNNAIVENPESFLKVQKFIGTPIEIALLSVAIQSGLNKKEMLREQPKIDELQFSSDKKYMITLHKKKKGGFVLYEKGAPEIILDKCSKFYHLGKETKLSINHRVKLDNNYDDLNKTGLRVVGVAIKEIKKLDWNLGKSKWEDIDNGLTFVGFIALKDPLRLEAKEAINEARKAGIRPVIITGDHKSTAIAIGKEVGFKIESKIILTGDDLDNMDDEELKIESEKIGIYARVSPHHKLRIVKALQARGEVVAMAGDGVNDSPALKAADIGISLGTGTDIAKETSDMVLLDDNFSVMVSAIKQGRIIFSNLRKVITFVTADSFSEIILIVGSILLNAPLAVLPVQILWINIINDGLPGFSLAFEEGEKDLMDRKPIKRKEKIINGEMKSIIFGAGLIRDFIIFFLFVYLLNKGMNIDYLRTLFFAILGTKSLATIFSLRSLSIPIWKLNPFGNKKLIIGVSASFLMLLLAIYWHPLQIIMSSVKLSIDHWIIVFGCAFLSIFLTEMAKLLFAEKESKKTKKETKKKLKKEIKKHD